jgi:hypothetical protein
MRNLLICTIVIAGASLLWLGCSKTSADQLTGNTNPCDTTTVGYTKDILPILQQFCYSCHSNANKAFSDGIDLENSDSGYQAVSGWAMAGYLVGNVTHASGYVGMPYGKPKLDDCEINKIIAWVNRQYPH